jgi:hypothetical protein
MSPVGSRTPSVIQRSTHDRDTGRPRREDGSLAARTLSFSPWPAAISEISSSLTFVRLRKHLQPHSSHVAALTNGDKLTWRKKEPLLKPESLNNGTCLLNVE